MCLHKLHCISLKACMKNISASRFHTWSPSRYSLRCLNLNAYFHIYSQGISNPSFNGSWQQIKSLTSSFLPLPQKAEVDSFQLGDLQIRAKHGSQAIGDDRCHKPLYYLCPLYPIHNLPLQFFLIWESKPNQIPSILTGSSVHFRHWTKPTCLSRYRDISQLIYPG